MKDGDETPKIPGRLRREPHLDAQVSALTRRGRGSAEGPPLRPRPPHVTGVGVASAAAMAAHLSSGRVPLTALREAGRRELRAFLDKCAGSKVGAAPPGAHTPPPAGKDGSPNRPSPP